MLKRICCILLASLMLLSFVACSKDNGGGDEDQGSGQNTVVFDVETDDPAKVLEVPQKDFGGKQLVIFQRDEFEDEFYSEAMTGELIPDAVYNRNKFVEGYLNVTFGWATATGKSTGQKQALDNSMVTGEEVYHISVNTAIYGVTWLSEAMFHDLNSIPAEINHINPSKIWWNQSYSKEATLNGKLFYLVGDATTTAMTRLEVLTVNETLLDEYLDQTAEQLLNRVYDRTWTYEYFLQCVECVGNATENGGMYGASLQRNATSIDGFLGALSIPIVSRTEGGNISLAYNGEKTLEIAEALHALYQENNSIYAYETENYDTGFVEMFTDGNAIFYGGLLGDVGTYFKDLGWDYAVLPFPIWDENQAEYRACPHDEYSVLGIPITVNESLEATTAAMEVLAAESYRSLRPVMYEKAYQHRYLKTSAKAQMFDYIIDHTYYDFGYIYTMSMGKPIMDIFRSYVCYGPGNGRYVAELTSKIEETWEANTELLNDYLDAFS